MTLSSLFVQIFLKTILYQCEQTEHIIYDLPPINFTDDYFFSILAK